METVLKINRGLRRVEEVVMVISIWAMAVILFANVIARLVFQHALNFAEELSTTLTVYITFVGLSYCARTGRHIAMTAIFDAVNPKIKKIMMCIIAIVVIVFMIVMAYISFRYVSDLQRSGRYTPALHLSLWKLYAFIPIFFIITAIQYLLILILNFRDKGVVHTCIDELPSEYVADEDEEEAGMSLMGIKEEGGKEDGQ